MSKPYVVVVGTDFSKQAERDLLAAYEKASQAAPAELHVVHAVITVCLCSFVEPTEPNRKCP